MSKQTRAVIVAARRTPIGSFLGQLSGFDATMLGSLSIRSALDQGTVSPSEVQEVIMGNVLSSNLGQAPARQAALNAGLSSNTICTTLNKVCSSGMKSVMYATQNIELGIHNCVVAGGFESMTNAPYYLPKVRQGLKMGDGQLIDSLQRDGLSDAYNGQPMGVFAEQCSKDYNISREEQDEYAINSYKRAAEANENGYFASEIASIAIPPQKKGGETTYMNHDEEYKNIKFDKVPQLKPVFVKENGTVTAANSSTISDGGASLVIMSEEKAKKAGYKPIARILGYGDAEKDPSEFTTAPAQALPVALKHAGVNKSDVDLWEINEAFSVVALANMKLLDLDPNTVNVFGGAVSLGHPIGCSGARILCTLISALRQKGKTLGAAGICNGGGGSSSMVLELL